MATDQLVPTFIEPMLLISGEGAPPRSAAWALEPKWDGCRAQLRAVDGDVTLRTRPGRDVTALFPEIAPIVAALPARAILDGELVCVDPDDGMPDFELLRPRLSMTRRATIAAAATQAPAQLIVFDRLSRDSAPAGVGGCGSQ